MKTTLQWAQPLLALSLLACFLNAGAFSPRPVVAQTNGVSVEGQAPSLGKEEDEERLQPQSEEEERVRRGWNELNGVWGKRGWNDLSGVWGKRGWNELNGVWGKKRGWNNLNGMWGKKRGWNDLSGMWGKRGGNWNQLKGLWGKRSDGAILPPRGLNPTREFLLLQRDQQDGVPLELQRAMTPEGPAVWMDN